VDHRTDVYSLGVTLYELLTGKPGVEGKDREEILNAITLDQPRPPRTLDASIPAELETIVLKALEKSPTDRYATAQELADDLRRFLGHEPIRARRPSPLLRLRKWGQRHRNVVASAAVCLFVVVVVLAISTVVIWLKQRETDAAYHAAEEQRQEADKQRNEAVTSLKDAQAAVDQMLYRVGDRTLSQVPQMELVRREILTDALRFYERLLQRAHAGPKLRLQAAIATIHAGDVHLMLGDDSRAEEIVRRGIALAEESQRLEPASADCRQVLADGWLGLGTVYLWRNQAAEAEKALMAARDALVESQAEPPASEIRLKALARAYADLGTVYARNRQNKSAEQSYRQALVCCERLIESKPDDLGSQQILAGVKGNLGTLLFAEIGRREEGERLINQAVELQETIFTADPTPEHRARLANLYRDLGLRRKQQGQLNEAATAHQKAVALLSPLQRDFPHVPNYAHSYARALLFLGKDRMALARDPAALDSLTQAERLYARLAEDFPKQKEYAREFAWCCGDRAALLASSNDPKVRNPAAAIDPAKKAVELVPEDGKHWSILGGAYYRAGQWDAALQALREAGRHSQPGQRMDLFFLAMTYWKLDNKTEARKQYGEAEAWRRRHVPNMAEPAVFAREAAQLLGMDAQQPD
jgi:tetratricopeptide (TPR) repeat protein